jgi:hypothetical protein
MGRRTKPTNRELLESIMRVNQKVDMMCSTTQSLLTDFILFSKKDKKFQDYLNKKYENTKQDQDT